MMNKDEIESILKSKDFHDFKWIDPGEIIVAHWVRVKCTFGCPDYGLGACPPNTPSVSDCESFFKEYETGLIIRLNKYADKHAYPSDWSKEATEKLLDIERKIFLSGHHKVFLLNQTCCDICKDCPGTRIDCRDKRKSRPSPESFAVDVFQTVRKAGLNIHVISENPSDINRIAILLIE